MVIIKECTICNENKELDQFYSFEKASKRKGVYTYYYPYCKECAIEKQQKRYFSDVESGRAYSKNWSKENKEIHDVMKKNWKIKNEDHARELYSIWQKSNPDKVYQYNYDRNLKKKHEISNSEWKQCKAFFDNKCAYCGIPIEEHLITYRGKQKLSDFHKEHLDNDGANDITNCVPSCKGCNCKKHDRDFEEWYTEENEVFNEERKIKIYKWISLMSKPI